MRNLLIISILFSSFSSWALSDFEVSGEMNFALRYSHLPTGDRGVTKFEMSSLFLDVNVPLPEDDLFVLTLEGSEQQEVGRQHFSVGVREAYLDLVSVFSGLHALRVGLIPQPWQEAQYELWPYRFLGKDAWDLTEKWNYQSSSDLGVSFMSELPWSLGEWALTIVNGEGLEQPEQGRYKEGSLFLRFAHGRPLAFSVSYTRGQYDPYESAIAMKQRIQALLSYEGDGWLAGLEYLDLQDPANALQDHKMAEQIDVLDYLGTEVKGEGASLFLSFETGEVSDLMVRYDYLNPLKGEDDRDLHTFMTGWGWSVTEGVKTAFMIDYTHYGYQYSSGARDRSKLSWATQVLF